MEPLMDALADAIVPLMGQPFAFFGHSMGAGIAFELARALRRRGRPLPVHLHGLRSPRAALPHRLEARSRPHPRRTDRADAPPGGLSAGNARKRGIDAADPARAGSRYGSLPALHVHSPSRRSTAPSTPSAAMPTPTSGTSHLEMWALETSAAFDLRHVSGRPLLLADGRSRAARSAPRSPIASVFLSYSSVELFRSGGQPMEGRAAR